MKNKIPNKFTEIMDLQKILDKTKENKNLKNIVFLKMKLVEKIVDFYNLKSQNKSDRTLKMFEIIISLAQFLNYLFDNNLQKRYNVHSSNSELVLALIESIVDFKLKLRNVLEILCNFGGIYEIEMEDIYKKYYEFWRNEMESEDENK